MAKILTTQALEDLPRPLENRKRVSAWLQSSSNARSNAQHDKPKEHPDTNMVGKEEGESGKSDKSGDSQRGPTGKNGLTRRT